MRVVELEKLQNLSVAQTATELKLAKLNRLKAAGRIEVVSKLVELLRRHRLQDVHLLFEQPLDRVYPAKVLADGGQVVAVERRQGGVHLVQDLFEPQLVDLMDDDEEHLVVMRGTRKRPLQGEKLVNFEIGSI